MAIFRNFENQSQRFMTIFRNFINQGVSNHSKIKILRYFDKDIETLRYFGFRSSALSSKIENKLTKT